LKRNKQKIINRQALAAARLHHPAGADIYPCLVRKNKSKPIFQGSDLTGFKNLLGLDRADNST